MFTKGDRINIIRTMDMLIASGEGYIPTYTRTDITDALHDAFGFRTDYQITSQKNKSDTFFAIFAESSKSSYEIAISLI